MLRFSAIAVFLAVPACTVPFGPLPSTGAPTPEAVAQAQAVCPGATFETTAPPDHEAYWFRC